MTYIIKMKIHTGFAGATHEETIEVTSEELGDQTIESYCEAYLEDMIRNYIETDWEVLSTE